MRRGAVADLREVMRLERESATAPHWTLQEYEGAVRGGEGNLRRVLLVAEEDGMLAGFAVGKLVGEGGDAEAELESVVVDAGKRRRGIGGKLCLGVMDWVREQGCGWMLLEVRVGSVGAIELYTALGWVAEGRRRGYYANPQEDALVMRCDLRSRAGGRSQV